VIRPAFRNAVIAQLITMQRVVWIGFGVSVLFYIGVSVWFTRMRQQTAVPSDVVATLTPALYALAAAAALLTVWWRRHLAPENLVAATAAAPAMPATAPANAGPGPVPESAAERRAVAVIARLRTQSIVLWMLSEVPAVFGMVLSVLGGDPRHALGLGAASVVLLAMHAPTRARVEAALDAVPKR
jgi:hypothetical protein